MLFLIGEFFISPFAAFVLKARLSEVLLLFKKSDSQPQSRARNRNSLSSLDDFTSDENFSKIRYMHKDWPQSNSEIMQANARDLKNTVKPKFPNFLQYLGYPYFEKKKQRLLEKF